jgi:glycosyltransferase involved in cell wall biosynthesis
MLATTYHRWRRFFDLIDIFVVTNRFSEEVAKQAGFAAERLVCLPTPVDVRDVLPGAACGRRDVLIYVGRLDPMKGLETLIAGFARLRTRQEFRAYRLILCGEGEAGYVARLHDLCRSSGVEESVEFRGKVGREDVLQGLSQARASIVPSSWFENLPNSLLESFATGTPVVATRLGSLEATVEEGVTGMLFRREDAEDLERVLRELLSSRERLARMGERARAFAVERHSVEAHLAGLLGVFEMAKTRVRHPAAESGIEELPS